MFIIFVSFLLNIYIINQFIEIDLQQTNYLFELDFSDFSDCVTNYNNN